MHSTLMHYSKVTPSIWPYQHFTPREVACRHCGELILDAYARSSLEKLEELRCAWGRPIILNSAHRCYAHNRNVGGAKNSQHLRLAFDCCCAGHDQAEFIRLAESAGFTGIGAYPRFVHLDCGPKRRW